MAENHVKQLCKVDCGRAKCINGTCMVYQTLKQCYTDNGIGKKCVCIPQNPTGYFQYLKQYQSYCGNWSDLLLVVVIAFVTLTLVALSLPIITWLVLRRKNFSNIKKLLRNWLRDEQKYQQSRDQIQVAQI